MCCNGPIAAYFEMSSVLVRVLFTVLRTSIGNVLFRVDLPRVNNLLLGRFVNVDWTRCT